MIVKNLIVANVLLLFSRGIGYVVNYFDWYQQNDVGCKCLLYFGGIGRGVSISTTCLLSVVQAFTISPQGSRWAGLREKAAGCILPCIALCWVLSMLANIVYPMYMSSVLSHKNDTSRKTFGKCSSVRHDPTGDFLYGALLSLPDVVFIVIMLWASGSMVCTLHRHRQRVRHLHRSSASSTSSPESRATRTILLLVSTFVCFNIIASIMKTVLSAGSERLPPLLLLAQFPPLAVLTSCRGLSPYEPAPDPTRESLWCKKYIL
ncbi:Vomeronasal type-1 receptor 4 [Galemys pyrenaicus]|uniref:Vomeronasal type-1 receptor n=1 Tax=Galemys pyrenaicus TaxID=202257 RepID=A0A8J6AQ07_GALPY|nr:Vomeronasal type-1 receptor 4 [Galemys pyrenaicus]